MIGKHIAIVSALLGALMSAAPASAQETHLGRSGDLALGAERLFGFLSTTYSTDEGAVEDSTSLTQFSLFSGGGMSPYSSPRLALDYFVADSISIGGTFGLATVSSETELTLMGTTMTNDGDSLLAIVFGGRVGYAFMLGNSVALWPHLGLTYFTASAEQPDNDERNNNGLAVSLDAIFVFIPAPHIGLSVGPVVDLGLTGTTENVDGASGMSAEADNTITDWGAQAGVLVWF